MNRELLCKDCKHSEASWLERVTKTTFAFKCTLPESWNEEEFSPVTGVTRPGYFTGCNVMRSSFNKACGAEALAWEPRNFKRDMFKYIKHQA